MTDKHKIKKILRKYNIETNSTLTITTSKQINLNNYFNYNKNLDCSNLIDISFMDGLLKDKNINIFLNVVDSIIKNITTKNYKHFTDIFIMEHNDFVNIKEILSPNAAMDYDGIRLVKQNIILCTNKIKTFSAFILIFHEIAHSFYPYTKNVFTDEYNAMCFEINATKKLLDSISTDKVTYYTDYNNYLPKGTIHYNAYEKALKDTTKLKQGVG